MTDTHSDQPPPAEPGTGLAKAGQQLVEQLLRLGVDGFGPFSSAEQSAQEAMKGRSKDQAVKILIRNHCLVAGSQGSSPTSAASSRCR